MYYFITITFFIYSLSNNSVFLTLANNCGKLNIKSSTLTFIIVLDFKLSFEIYGVSTARVLSSELLGLTSSAKLKIPAYEESLQLEPRPNQE